MSDYYNSMDPSDMESRFSNEDSFAFMESIFSEPTEDDKATIRKVKDLLAFIPQREADFIEMFFFHQIRQIDIARMFKVSQPTVCYRLKRAAVRIRFLLEIAHVSDTQFKRDLQAAGLQGKDLDIVMLMVRYTSQTKVAEMLGLTQSHVRHRFINVTHKLIAEDEHIRTKYGPTFIAVQKNPNILRDVSKRIVDSEVLYMVLTD
jgi:DNA-directed RNA polymerase specialized sigma subunit